MCKHQHRRGHRVGGVGLQLGHVVLALPHAHVLGFLDHDELPVGHHGEAAGRSEHLVHVRITPIQHRLVEVLEALVHHRAQQGLDDLRNEERLFAVQDVHRRQLSRGDVPNDLAVRHGREGRPAPLSEVASCHGPRHASPSVAPCPVEDPTRGFGQARGEVFGPTEVGGVGTWKSGCASMWSTTASTC